MKIKNYLKLIVFLLSSLMLVACNNNNNNNNHHNHDTVTVQHPSVEAQLPVLRANKVPNQTDLVPTISTVLEGVWIYNKCIFDTNNKFSQPNDWYVHTFENYRNRKLEEVSVWSLNSTPPNSCHRQVLTVNKTFSFTLGDIENKGTQDEYTKINMTPTRLVVTITQEDVVFRLNNQASTSLGDDFGFGITNWQIYEPMDLTNNKLAMKYFGLDKTNLDIFHINKDKIFEGDQGGNKDADGRPITLNTKVWGTKEGRGRN